METDCEHHAYHVKLWEAIYDGRLITEEPPSLVPVFERMRQRHPHVSHPYMVQNMCGIVTELYKRIAWEHQVAVADAEMDMGETNHIVGITITWEPKAIYIVDFSARQFWPCAPVPLVVASHRQP